MLTDEQLRNVMLNLYPQKENSTETSKIMDEPQEQHDHFIHPYIQQESKNGANKKKWIFSIILSSLATLLSSQFFITFLDEFCLKKDISILDENGNPKIFLMLGLFLFLLILNRISFELI